ncbi:hypothetical protein [Prauserella muralis]|uniref:Uncharacterized protein n=1 Tax=Prauserella muralis TaxID=588067 RepID=A0A2V4ALH9_9PSEU|nr:hypothetical protein [Prauserella muralis]PXY20843.1 hypothetical protein BAY60_25400 [Prauserella muralis]TWE29879.1 hypothetical protein FHX69_2571 [Prauserella muralis]
MPASPAAFVTDTVEGTLFNLPTEGTVHKRNREMPRDLELALERGDATPRERREIATYYTPAADERERILAAARAVKPFRPAARPRAPRAPKPGDGTFSPKPGAPGSAVRVLVVDADHTVPSFVATGCVMFPAPGGPRDVWVSLWDGRTPVGVRLTRDLDATEDVVRLPRERVEELREIHERVAAA